MKIRRRDLLFAGGLSLLAGPRAFGHGAIASDVIRGAPLRCDPRLLSINPSG